ncbi:acyl-CoA N-acyltransferase [Rhizoctonia solani]|nr:acyl-CoA N-acyltransferase [Rhizoctonia solani]
MHYHNQYSSPQPNAIHLSPNHVKLPYDVNFCFPIRALEDNKVVVTPLIPSVHAKTVFELISEYPCVMRYMSIHSFLVLSAFEAHCESARANPETCLFVIIKQGTQDEIQGIINFCHASPVLSTIEIGSVIVFPPYQGTHVSTHAIGLMMQYALDVPSLGGLGVRRLQWQCYTINIASIKVAQRMGFNDEAIIRWHRPQAIGKESCAPFRADDSLGLPGRHSAYLSVCWDDWEGGVRDRVAELLKSRG